jgi:hypothetical protein
MVFKTPAISNNTDAIMTLARADAITAETTTRVDHNNSRESFS